jgi:hypothetical protein
MKQLGQQQIEARAWAISGTTPGPIRLRIGSHDFVLDRKEAIHLAAQLVAAVDQLKGEKP